ncbi:hypothetical protein Lser_V15G33801 [Lactuca serriola]
MIDHDMTLNDLTYLLDAAESEMIWSTGKTNFIGRSTSKTYMDIDNGNIGSPEKPSLPDGKGSTIVNPVDQMVKRKAKSEIVPCTIPKESICVYCQKKGHWLRSCPIYLKDHKMVKSKSLTLLQED